MQDRCYRADLDRPRELPDAGKVRATLLIYLLVFSIALVLFVHGPHVIALTGLALAGATLVLWLRGVR
jgi:hypothetical protein